METNATNKGLVTFLLFDSYLSAIKNSIGSKQYRNLYAQVQGKKTDILRNGDLSCAYYVSSILSAFQLTKTAHATISGVIRDMENCGWEETKHLRVGCVLMWGDKFFEDSGETHAHIGFYIGKDKAVSTSDTKKCPTKHVYRVQDGRPLVKIFWHPALEQ